MQCGLLLVGQSRRPFTQLDLSGSWQIVHFPVAAVLLHHYCVRQSLTSLVGFLYVCCAMGQLPLHCAMDRLPLCCVKLCVHGLGTF